MQNIKTPYLACTRRFDVKPCGVRVYVESSVVRINIFGTVFARNKKSCAKLFLFLAWGLLWETLRYCKKDFS